MTNSKDLLELDEDEDEEDELLELNIPILGYQIIYCDKLKRPAGTG